jgi:hypothetical protein
MDKYDEAIAYLTEHPEEIHDVWNNANFPCGRPGECLFVPVTNTDDGLFTCGCLTQVKQGIKEAETPALTAAIRVDKRIPTVIVDDVKQTITRFDITVESLPIFAEWQRRIDKELGRS